MIWKQKLMWLIIACFSVVNWKSRMLISDHCLIQVWVKLLFLFYFNLLNPAHLRWGYHKKKKKRQNPFVGCTDYSNNGDTMRPHYMSEWINNNYLHFHYYSIQNGKMKYLIFIFFIKPQNILKCSFPWIFDVILNYYVSYMLYLTNCFELMHF